MFQFAQAGKKLFDSLRPCPSLGTDRAGEVSILKGHPHAQAGTIVPHPDGGIVTGGAIGGEAVCVPVAGGVLISAGQTAGEIGNHIGNLHGFESFLFRHEWGNAVCRGSGRQRAAVLA